MNLTPKQRAKQFIEKKSTLRAMHSASLYGRAVVEDDLTKEIQDAMRQAYDHAIQLVQKNITGVGVGAYETVSELERAKTDLLI